MAEPRRLQRLSASDIFFLSWDDFGWSGDIGALAVLDGAPLLDRDGRLRIQEVRQGSSRDLAGPPSGPAPVAPTRAGLAPMDRRPRLRPRRPRPRPPTGPSWR